jgi:hypothetical protein
MAQDSPSEKKPERVRLPSGRKDLRELIQTCNAIKERKFNPFFLDVNLAIQILRKYFPFWNSLDDNCLDAETVKYLAETLDLQRNQLRYQSSAFYMSPEMLEKKLRSLSVKRLGEVFLKSWHPIVEKEQLTLGAIRAGLLYWDQLASYEERRRRLMLRKAPPPQMTELDLLVKSGLVTREEFTRNLRALWEELRALTEKGDSVDYWSFVRRGTYQETVQRAYHVSFLLTYGFAQMRHDSENIKIRALAEPTGKAATGLVSFPIAISQANSSQTSPRSPPKTG